MKVFILSTSLIIPLLAPGISYACWNDSECPHDKVCECPGDPQTGNCSYAGVCVSLEYGSKELSESPFFPEISETIPKYVAEGDEADESARDFVRMTSPGKCGPAASNGRFVQIENTHASKEIYVTYTVRFYYQGRPKIETKSGRWRPGRSSVIGCTVPGPTNQRFLFDILSARF